MQQIHAALDNVASALQSLQRKGGSVDPHLQQAVTRLYDAQVLMAQKLESLLGGAVPKHAVASDITKPFGRTIRPFLFEQMKEGERCDVDTATGRYKLYRNEELVETGIVSAGCRVADVPEEAPNTASAALETAPPTVDRVEAVKTPEKAEPRPAKVAETATNERPATVGVGKPVVRNQNSASPGVGKPVVRQRLATSRG